MSGEALEAKFPYLQKDNYSITSPISHEYNCIAWAAGDTQRWWQPNPRNLLFNTYYWPRKAINSNTIEAYISAFRLLGYKQCDNSNPEKNFEKVAIYVNEIGKPTHMTRQLDSGIWTSKIGEDEDIIHHTLKALEDSDYGKVAVILKRPK
ncbi:hypothetical protein KKB18_04210 [bacterium]|nr:hypothetical protein [bacterium]